MIKHFVFNYNFFFYFSVLLTDELLDKYNLETDEKYGRGKLIMKPKSSSCEQNLSTH